MAAFTSLQHYLTRPTTFHEKIWMYDDFLHGRRMEKYHRQEAEQYKNSNDIGGQLKFAHHIQEAERWKVKESSNLSFALGPKTNLVKPDLNRPAFILEPGKAELIKMNKCPTCKKNIHVDNFKTDIQRKEYAISGMCVECQSKMIPN